MYKCLHTRRFLVPRPPFPLFELYKRTSNLGRVRLVQNYFDVDYFIAVRVFVNEKSQKFEDSFPFDADKIATILRCNTRNVQAVDEIICFIMMCAFFFKFVFCRIE